MGLLSRAPTEQQLARVNREPEGEVAPEMEVVPETAEASAGKAPAAVVLLEQEKNPEPSHPEAKPRAKALISVGAKNLPQAPRKNILSKLPWSIQPWADQGEIIIREDPPRRLTLVTEKSTKGKISLAAFLPPNYLAEAPAAISTSVSMRSQTNLSLACYVRTRKAGEYFESRVMPLGKTASELVFNLAEPIWKTERSKWEFTEKIPPGREISEIGFVIYDVTEGSAVRFEKIEIILPVPKLPAVEKKG